MIRNTLLLIVVIFLSGCYSDADICSNYINYHKGISYNIVLKSVERTNRQIDFYGYNPHNYKKEYYSGSVSDYYSNSELINVGDTIMKNENEMLFKIKKSDTTIVIKMACSK